MLAFGELLEAHFGAPKNGKSRRYRHHYTPIRCIFSYCFFALFFHLFFLRNIKKKRTAITIRRPGAYLLHKKSVSPTCIEFRHLRFLRNTNSIWGGSAARDAAHSTSSAYSDGGSTQKKSMGKSKKCALTVKQFSVTT